MDGARVMVFLTELLTLKPQAVKLHVNREKKGDEGVHGEYVQNCSFAALACVFHSARASPQATVKYALPIYT